jgi:hemolysin activation/secretion protein
MKFNTQPVMKPLFAALLVTLPGLVNAQPDLPGAGAILRQSQPAASPSPSSTRTDLTIDREADVKLPPDASFQVTSIRITGNKKIATETLHALVADSEGGDLNLVQLTVLAARITAHYRSQGYPLARAIIPAQTIRAGIVEFQIIEAHYGKISLDNRSPVSDALLLATLSPLQIGEVVQQQELDKTLLLLSDVPGVLVNAKLNAGEIVGTSDLEVSTRTSPAVYGNIGLDNYGSRYTGKSRIYGSVNIINPLNQKFSNVLSLGALKSDGGLSYGRIAYESVVNGQGTRLGASYLMLRYALGAPLATLKVNGTAMVRSLWVKQPLMRSRDINLYGQIQYDNKQLKDRVDTTGIRTDRYLDNLTLSLAGDALLLGGINSWSLGWTSGRVGFGDSAAQLTDAATAKTQGEFSKWNANLTRLQSLSPRSALYLSLSGQWSNTNLDAAEKMSAGGPSAVRAYDTGALSGDTGYLAVAEWRQDMGAAWGGQWQALAFMDSARVTLNKKLWPQATSTNNATLSGAGIGLNWVGSQWSAKSYVATALGPTPALVPTNNAWRAWVEVSRRF